VGIDLRDGNPSLPVVLSLQEDAEVARIFRLEQPTETDVETAMARIRTSGVLDRVRRMAAQYAGRARDDMKLLRPSDDRDQLLLLVDQLMARTE
jgi:all-trans-nonaprenyl-diphosphate synthase